MERGWIGQGRLEVAIVCDYEHLGVMHSKKQVWYARLEGVNEDRAAGQPHPVDIRRHRSDGMVPVSIGLLYRPSAARVQQRPEMPVFLATNAGVADGRQAGVQAGTHQH